MNTINNMVVMHYQTPLPDDTDFAQIRNRVSEIGPLFDRLPGLVFKLYGLNEPGTAPIPEYSSIYLWERLESMYEFLSGELFANYSAVFARPAVRWFLVHATRGDVVSVASARYAVRRLAPFPRRVPVGGSLSNWQAKFEREGAIFQVLAFDPTNWEVVDLSIWDQKPEIGNLDHLYALARTSVPELVGVSE
jgi:hypothetical protein